MDEFSTLPELEEVCPRCRGECGWHDDCGDQYYRCKKCKGKMEGENGDALPGKW